MTSRLDKRIGEHNSGKTKSTKGYLPWVLVYSKAFENRTEARDWEKYLMSGIEGDF